MCKAEVRRVFSKEFVKRFFEMAQVCFKKELFVIPFLSSFLPFHSFSFSISFDKEMDFSLFSSATTANKEENSM